MDDWSLPCPALQIESLLPFSLYTPHKNVCVLLCHHGPILLVLRILVNHLQVCSSEATLDVKALNVGITIEYALVAAQRLGQLVKCLDDAQSKLFALLIFGDGNVFNVTNAAKIADAGGWWCNVSWVYESIGIWRNSKDSLHKNRDTIHASK